MTLLPTVFEFHHIGVGVLDFDAAVDAYRSLMYFPIIIVDDKTLGVRVAFLTMPDLPGPLVEILAPLGKTSPLDSLIKRKLLPSPYHTCYATTDYTGSAEALTERGFVRITEPTPAIAMAGARIAFFFHHAIGLLEIVENPPFWARDGYCAEKPRSNDCADHIGLRTKC